MCCLNTTEAALFFPFVSEFPQLLRKLLFLLRCCARERITQQYEAHIVLPSVSLSHTCRMFVVQALKSVKGVLNKLTPEKFDRLLGQLVAAVTSVDVLNGLIKLVFDNAVDPVLPMPH